MPLELRPATEEDAARAAEIEGLAFAPSPFSGILFPGPFPPGSGGRRVAELVEKLRGDDSTRWLKVVDTDLLLEGTGEGEGEGESGKQEEKEKQPTMIAFAQWHVYADGKPRSAPRTFGPECNLEACEMLFGGIDRQRRRLMGERPYVYLRLLHTDPKHQGRGAGGMLVRWGVEEAKRLGLPAYLESSEAGHYLYQKCGFRDVELQSLDFTKWGATGRHNTWAMAYEQSP